jgi:hypothetical protein
MFVLAFFSSKRASLSQNAIFSFSVMFGKNPKASL